MKKKILLGFFIAGSLFAAKGPTYRVIPNTNTLTATIRIKGNYEASGSTWINAGTWTPTIIIFGTGTAIIPLARIGIIYPTGTYLQFSDAVANRVRIGVDGGKAGVMINSGSLYIAGTLRYTSGGLVRATAGTTGTPALSFASDINTGFANIGSNGLMQVILDGVIIGTFTPSGLVAENFTTLQSSVATNAGNIEIALSSITVNADDISVLKGSVTINTDNIAVLISSVADNNADIAVLKSSVTVNADAISVLESSATANADNIEILLSSATAIHDNYARLDSSPTWTGSHKFVQIEVDSITITSGCFVIVGTVTWSEDSDKLDGEHGSYYGVKDDIGFSTAANATDIYNLKVSTGNNKDRIYATEQATGTLLTKSSATATYVDKNYKGFVSTGAAGDEMAGKLTVLSTITVNYIQMGDIERGHLRGADNKEFRIETWGVSGKIKINHRAFPTSPYANFQWGATVINGFQGIRNGNLFLQTGGITYLTINSSGNIGIRTQNPGYGLEIATNTRIQYELHTTTIQAQNANGLYLTDENGVEHIGIYDDKTTLKSSTVTIPGYLDTEQAIKGWVKFDGTIDPPTINDSYNVTSVADSTGDGHYIITWIAPFSDADYCVTLCSNGESSYIQTMAAGSVTIFTVDAAGTATDRSIVTVMAVGNR